MKICFVCISFSLLQTCLGHGLDYNAKMNALNARKRILIMSRALVQEDRDRLMRMNPFRWMYEESPHYEAGYLFGEIMERYRKMVEITRRSRGLEDIYYHMMYHLENVQSLYLELYHLVGMIHEIPRKWANEPEFAEIRFYHDTGTFPDSGTISPEEQAARWKRLFEIYKERRRRRRQALKLWRQHRQLADIYNQYKGNLKDRQPKNNRWEKDYGWEPFITTTTTRYRGWFG